MVLYLTNITQVYLPPYNCSNKEANTLLIHGKNFRKHKKR